MSNDDFVVPKYFEGLDLPDEYFTPSEGPCFEKQFYLNLRKLMRYAETENKKIDDLTRDEIMMFSTKDTFEETFPWLFKLIREKREKASV
jgi:hypothetical protein